MFHRQNNQFDNYGFYYLIRIIDKKRVVHHTCNPIEHVRKEEHDH